MFARVRHCGLLKPTWEWLGTGGHQVIDDEPFDIPGRSGTKIVMVPPYFVQ